MIPVERTPQLRDCKMRCWGGGKRCWSTGETGSTKAGRTCARGKTVSSGTTWKFVILRKWEHQVAKPRWKQFGKLVLLACLFRSIKCQLTADPSNCISKCSYSREIRIDHQTHDFRRIAHISNILNTQKAETSWEPSRSSAEWVIKTRWPSFSFHFWRLFCFSVCVYVRMYIYIWVPEKARSIRSLGAKIIEGCNPSDRGLESQTWVLCKSSKCSNHYAFSAAPNSSFLTCGICEDCHMTLTFILEMSPELSRAKP